MSINWSISSKPYDELQDIELVWFSYELAKVLKDVLIELEIRLER